MCACQSSTIDIDTYDRIILPPDAGTTCPVCTEDPDLALEFFGNGTADFVVPLATTTVLAADLTVRNLIFQDGGGGPSIIDPNGFVIRVAGTTIVPGLDIHGNPQAFIARDGKPANFTSGGPGIPASGTIGGASGAGGLGQTGNGSGGGAPDLWPSSFHPGAGGTGGAGFTTTGGAGGIGSLIPESSGSLDIFAALRMRIQTGSAPLGGGAGGGGGGGDNGSGTDVSIGGGGGGGAGNIVFISRQIDNASNLVISSRGGAGGSAIFFGAAGAAGGGGGGGGGDVTVLVYRKPFPVIRVSGGNGGAGFGGGAAGATGSSGTAIPFSFVL